jgi:hypothetical protein
MIDLSPSCAAAAAENETAAPALPPWPTNQATAENGDGNDSDDREEEGSADNEDVQEELCINNRSRLCKERVFLEKTFLYKDIVFNKRGTLGFKTTESPGGNLVVKEVTAGKQGEAAGLRMGDVVVSGAIHLNGEKTPSIKWNSSIMPHHGFYSLLMSKRRPVILVIKREGGEEDDDGSQNPQPSTVKKRGRKRKQISLEEERPGSNKLRRWREDIIYAFELRVAADEIEAVSFGDSAQKNVDNATEKKKHESSRPKMGRLALQKQRAQIDAMREEAEALWNHPSHGEWENHLKELLQFRHDHGDFQVTSSNTPNEAFFGWVQNVRHSTKNKRASKMRETTVVGEEILNKIG